MSIAIRGTDGNPLTSRDIDANSNNFIYVQGRLIFSGAYVGGGDTIDWTTVTGLPIPSTSLISLLVETNGGSNILYSPIGGPATLLNAWLLKVFNGAFAELGAGAYPAAVLADVVTFQATFRKLL